MKRDYPEHNPDWLRVEHYAKLSKKENPYGFVCALCDKTHSTKDCPNKELKKVETKQDGYMWSKVYEQAEDNSCGW